MSGATRPPRAADAELLRAYSATTWWVRLPDAELPLRLGTPVAARLSLPAAVVTAYNPASERRGAQTNRAADRRLRARLRELGRPAHPVLARAPGDDRHWDEPGYLVTGVELDTALALGRGFGQNAIVWVGADRIPTLLVTRPGFCGARVGDRLLLPTRDREDRDAGS